MIYLLLAALYFGGLLTLIAVDPAHIRESERAKLRARREVDR